jgi:hypothetical protein
MRWTQNYFSSAVEPVTHVKLNHNAETTETVSETSQCSAVTRAATRCIIPLLLLLLLRQPQQPMCEWYCWRDVVELCNSSWPAVDLLTAACQREQHYFTPTTFVVFSIYSRRLVEARHKIHVLGEIALCCLEARLLLRRIHHGLLFA